jgi:hypothetical protein
MRGGLSLDRAPEHRIAGGYRLAEFVGQARGGAADEQQREQHGAEKPGHGQGLLLNHNGCSFELSIQPVLAAEHMQPSIVRTTCSSKARFKQCVEIFQQLRPEHETALGRVQARPPL